MKPKETFSRCEYCDKLIKITSPPTIEQYESAMIYIAENSDMLLPVASVVNNNHMNNIDGLYCCPLCLINNIKKILGKKSTERLFKENTRI